MDFDLGTDQDKMKDFVTVPAGTYLCRVAEVTRGTTRNGDERWGIRLIVAEGEFVGTLAAWDGIVFSERGRFRARRILAAMGLPSSGRVSIEPEDVLGKQVFVEVRPRDFKDSLTGEEVRRNEVPYDGYRAKVEGGSERKDEDGDGVTIPF